MNLAKGKRKRDDMNYKKFYDALPLFNDIIDEVMSEFKSLNNHEKYLLCESVVRRYEAEARK